MRQTISHAYLDQWLDTVRLSQLTPMVLGMTGVGKTQRAFEYAAKHNLHPVLIPLDAMYEMDVVGYAVPNKETRKFHYFPSTFFPVEGDAVPKGKDGWLIIIDEFGNCGASIQTAAQRLIFERVVGQYKLHEKAQFIILGNTIEAGANANPISNAVLTRCAVTELIITQQEYIKYLTDKGYHPIMCDVYSAMLNSATVVSTAPSEANTGQEALFTHRGYENLCTIVQKSSTNVLDTLKELSLDTNLNVVKSMLGDLYGSFFCNAVSKLLSNIHGKYAEIVQLNGHYTLQMADTYLLPVVLSKLYESDVNNYHHIMSELISTNMNQNNSEPLTALLKAIDLGNPELITHTKYDRVKATLLT